MLNIFLRLIAVIVAGLLVLALIGSLLPRNFDFRIERVVQAPAGKIYPQVADLKRWPDWTEWNTREKSFLKIELGPITEGEGASQTWSELRGDGKLWLTRAVPDQEICYQVRFGVFPEITNRIVLEPAGEGTKVTWTSQGRLPGGPFYGYFRGIFVAGLQREYNRCLERLEQQLNAPPAPPGPEAGAPGTAVPLNDAAR